MNCLTDLFSFRYGLIIPAKERSEAAAAAAVAKLPPKKRNVFGEDSDSEADEDTDWVKKTMKVRQ